ARWRILRRPGVLQHERLLTRLEIQHVDALPARSGIRGEEHLAIWEQLRRIKCGLVGRHAGEELGASTRFGDTHEAGRGCEIDLTVFAPVAKHPATNRVSRDL